MKHKVCPANCVACCYWWPMPSGNFGRCHCIYADDWSKWTKAQHTCEQQSRDHDRTLDDRQEVACLIRR